MGTAYTYQAYGLTLRVPFVCSGLSTGDPGTPPDLEVVEGEVPATLAAAELRGDGFEAAPGRLLLELGRFSGRFLVENGRRVTFQRGSTAEEAALGYHLINSIMAAVMRQRGYLVMHASVAARGSTAIMVMGVSGAGKSTTLAALCARGWSMLSDDVTVLQRSLAGEIQVLPGVPQVSLFEHTAQRLDMDVAGQPLYPWRRMKALIPSPAPTSSEPVPLRTVFILELGSGPTLEREKMLGAQRFGALYDGLYGPVLPSEYAGILPLHAAMTNQTTVFRLRRPSEPWSVDDVVAQITEDAFPPGDTGRSGAGGHAAEG